MAALAPERKHACETCAATFARPAELARHVRTHTGEKPFACKDCSATFAQAGTLARHAKSVHEDAGQFLCRTCKRLFRSEDTLRSHERHMHELPHRRKEKEPEEDEEKKRLQIMLALTLHTISKLERVITEAGLEMPPMPKSLERFVREASENAENEDPDHCATP
jgi:uncharacterized Zn-finger protein